MTLQALITWSGPFRPDLGGIPHRERTVGVPSLSPPAAQWQLGLVWGGYVTQTSQSKAFPETYRLRAGEGAAPHWELRMEPDCDLWPEQA